MSSTSIRQAEPDILSIIRELESKQAAPGKEIEAATNLPDPVLLRESLEKKRQLIALLDGYVDKKEISEKVSRLTEAIDECDMIIKVTS